MENTQNQPIKMRKLLFAALLALGTSVASAQGTLNLLNSNPDAQVTYGTDQFGHTIGAGVDSDFTAYLQMDGETVAQTPFIQNGIFSGGTVTLDGVPGPGPVSLEVYAENTDGTLYGSSGIFSQPLGGVGTPPSTPAGLAMPGFQVVPEPSHVALALLGGAALLFSRRRKKS